MIGLLIIIDCFQTLVCMSGVWLVMLGSSSWCRSKVVTIDEVVEGGDPLIDKDSREDKWDGITDVKKLGAGRGGGDNWR